MKAKLLAILTVLVLHPGNGQKCEEFQDWGFVCEDCKTMATCVNVAGTWKSLPLGKCDGKELFCNRETKSCSKTKKCGETTAVDFECRAEGIFPDPYSCHTYYACALGADSKFTSVKLQCPNSSAFSVKYNDCSAKSTDEICRSKQYKCDKVGDMASWPENANIFYVCIENTVAGIVPALYRCPLGETFSGDRCTSSPSKTTAPTTTTRPTTPQNSQPYQCLKAGLVAHSTNCTMYYYCNSKLRSVLYSCPQETYFNSIQKICVPGAC